MDYLKQLGENIRYYRVLAEMTQEELAMKVGYSGKASIAKIETGKSDLPQSKIKAIADALHITVAQLLDETHRIEENASLESLLLSAYHNSDEQTRRIVLYALKLNELLDKEGGGE